MKPALPVGVHPVAPGQIGCVVTRLEMLSRPVTLESVPEPAGLRHAKAFEPAPYRDLFRRVGAPWLWSSRLRLDDAALSAVLTDPDVEIWTVTRDGTDQALTELDFRGAGTCELVFFGLVPALTGQGLGRPLMAHAIRRAFARPIERLWLHTCTLDHPGALRFYIRNGFSPFDSAIGIMDDPRRTGLLPLDSAPHIPLL